MDNNVEVKKLRSLSDGRGRWARESERERERGGGRGDVGGVVQPVDVDRGGFEPAAAAVRVHCCFQSFFFHLKNGRTVKDIPALKSS